MKSFFSFGEHADVSARVLALPIRAMAVAPTDVIPMTAGLPAGSFLASSPNVVMAATPCNEPLFRNVIKGVCAGLNHDVMIIRTGLFPETLDPVSVDVALIGVDGPVVLNEMIFMRARNRALWLVPSRVGPFVELRKDGLVLEMVPPFVTWDERVDGVCAAAKEIVRIVKRGWVG